MAPHSLHCYFLLPGSSESPALYTVRRVRDGRSFATRLVTTTQRGRPIFSSMVSFHSTKERTTLEHADAMPDAPDPETLPDVSTEPACGQRPPPTVDDDAPRPADTLFPFHCGATRLAFAAG